MNDKYTEVLRIFFQVSELVVQSHNIVLSATILRNLHFFQHGVLYAPHGSHADSDYFPVQLEIVKETECVDSEKRNRISTNPYRATC